MRIAVGLGKKGGEERLAQQGVSRRDFLKFCTAVAVTMGLGPSMATEVAAALTNRRASVVYLHCAECTGCSEALLRTCKPFLDTLILDTISLDYHETIMAAAGEAAEAALEQAISNPEGFICVVEGAIPTAMDGKYGYVGGHTMLDLCKRVLPKAKAVVTMGTCAAYGGVQAAKPNPTHAVPITEIITDKPIVLVPGCPPIPEVMTAVITYILTYDRLPPLDRLGRPKMFYGQRIHDKCYRRAHFDAGQFVEKFDDEGAKLGYCLYKVGCKGPTTYNACSTVEWNEGLSWPVKSGHGCIGCSENNFFDKGSFYNHEPDILPPGWGGVEATVDKVGIATVAVVGVAAAAHAAMSAVAQARAKTNKDIGGKE